MKTIFFVPFFATLLFSLCGYSQDGVGIFKKNCAVCHTIGGGKIVGPDLKGSDKKHEIKWLIQWIKSSQTMITKKKDSKAIQIFNDNKQMIMPDQALSDDEIKTVMAFIGDETTKLEQAAVAPPNSTSVSSQTSVETSGLSQATSYSSIGVTSKTVIYILLGIIVFLTTILIGLGKIIKDLAKSQKK